mgnify:CR=1 FL=1
MSSGLTEREILDRYVQALGEAKAACQYLGLNADPQYLAPRGAHYGNLRVALQALEGSCRQMAHFRADARWIKLGFFYAGVIRKMQVRFIGQRWLWFKELIALFETGQRRMEALRDRRTGRTGAILPTQPTDWLLLPDIKRPQPRMPTFH